MRHDVYGVLYAIRTLRRSLLISACLSVACTQVLVPLCTSKGLGLVCEKSNRKRPLYVLSYDSLRAWNCSLPTGAELISAWMEESGEVANASFAEQTRHSTPLGR